MANELAVELKLKLDKLRGQSEQAGRDINSGLASSIKGLPPTHEEREEQRAKRERAQRNRKLDETDALKEQKSKEKEEADLRKANFVAHAKQMATVTLYVTAALALLRRSINEVSLAMERARNLYAAQLKSGGMAQSFVISQNILAKIIGVSERDVFQYGSAIAFLDSKVKNATETITKNNNVLTASAWNWKALNLSLEAYYSEVAAKLAPGINMLATIGSKLLDIVQRSVDFKASMFLIQVAMDALIQTIGALVLAFGLIELALTAVYDAILYFFRQVNNTLARFHVPGFKIDEGDKFTDVKKQWGDIKDIVKTLLTGGKETAPMPSVSIAREPSSTWEKMGLIIGQGGGAVNYAKRTADNTGQAVTLLGRLVASMIPISGIPNFFENPMYPHP